MVKTRIIDFKSVYVIGKQKETYFSKIIVTITSYLVNKKFNLACEKYIFNCYNCVKI